MGNRDPILRLRSAGRALPPNLRDEIVALGAPAIPGLVEIVRDPWLGRDEAPESVWPRCHAMALLVDLRATMAIDPLLDFLVRGREPGPWDDLVHGTVARQLPLLGQPVADAILVRMERGVDEAVHATFGGVLARTGARDPRILRELVVLLEREPDFGATCLRDYGHADALPALERAMRKIAPTDHRPRSVNQMAEIHQTYLELGGELSSELEAHVDSVMGLRLLRD